MAASSATKSYNAWPRHTTTVCLAVRCISQYALRPARVVLSFLTAVLSCLQGIIRTLFCTLFILPMISQATIKGGRGRLWMEHW